ncbi:MAG: hypothetical protein Q8L24_00805 [bacterium]|nr:hypothetical protein [bacterium]
MKVTKKEVNKFVKFQQSLQFYDKTKAALKEVLLVLPKNEYRIITDNLLIVALHEGVIGQVMHFPKARNGCKIMQLNIPFGIPMSVLKFVIAHELGHVFQGRNWKKNDRDLLEANADASATRWGFPRTKPIGLYIGHRWKNPEHNY